ncbi:MAG: Gfo/Idh/MocA family oxidoreductase, partial [Phycisphaerales bacterium]|nr:Gfo/Idh/MocA family oxidoreductase [Phycisphaerales bacterium]
PADVEAAIAKRDATGKIVLVSYNRRFIPVYQGIVKALRDGKIGKVHGVSLVHTENWFERNSTTWRTVEKMSGGGFILDTGAHTLDFIHHAIGKDTAVISARVDRMGSEVDVDAAVSFQFQDGPIGSVFTTGLGPAVAGYLWEDISFFGDKGAIMLRSVGPGAFLHPTVFWNDFETGETTVEASPDGIMDDYFPGPGTNFVNAVMGRPTAEYATLEDALRVHKFVDAVYRSADAGGNEVSV